MPKMILVCDFCGKEYTSYQCGKYNHFCSIECRRAGAYLMSQNITAEDRKRRSEQIIRVNKTVNNDSEHLGRRADTLRGRGSGKSYTKVNGVHEHRSVIEKKLGRPLRPDEIVHHKDGNKRNNLPENLEVMTQREHIREHLRRGGGRLARTVQTPKDRVIVSED